MTATARKLALTVHVGVSVGWLGAVVVFVAVGFLGLASDDPDTVRAAYRVMDPAARAVLVPLAVASLLTGLVQSVVTPWGLFVHYWVVFKLLINVATTFVLLVYLKTFRAMADVASDPTSDLDVVRNASPVLHGAAALVLLATATVLGMFKPRGLTPYGRRKRSAIGERA